MDDLETALRKIKPADLQTQLEPYFVAVAGLNVTSDRVFFPREYVSVKGLIAALLTQIQAEIVVDPDEGYETLEEKLFDEYGPDEVLEWFTDDARSWVVHCWVTDSRVSGDWGIMRFSLGNRGYLYHRPDWGVGDDESFRILACWEPVGDEEAFKACFLETYLKEWERLGLPPKVSQWVDGPSGLIQAAVLNVLKTNPEEWTWVVRKCHEDFSNKPPEIAGKLFKRLGISRRASNRILLLLNDDAETLTGKLVRGEVDQDEFHDLFDIFWALITPEERD